MLLVFTGFLCMEHTFRTLIRSGFCFKCHLLRNPCLVTPSKVHWQHPHLLLHVICLQYQLMNTTSFSPQMPQNSRFCMFYSLHRKCSPSPVSIHSMAVWLHPAMTEVGAGRAWRGAKQGTAQVPETGRKQKQTATQGKKSTRYHVQDRPCWKALCRGHLSLSWWHWEGGATALTLQQGETETQGEATEV